MDKTFYNKIRDSDWGILHLKKEKVIVKGKIIKIWVPKENYHIPPLSDRITVTLETLGSKRKTMYIKLESQEELDYLHLSEREKITIKGTLIHIDDKLILTEVSRVE